MTKQIKVSFYSKLCSGRRTFENIVSREDKGPQNAIKNNTSFSPRQYSWLRKVGYTFLQSLRINIFLIALPFHNLNIRLEEVDDLYDWQYICDIMQFVFIANSHEWYK